MALRRDRSRARAAITSPLEPRSVVVEVAPSGLRFDVREGESILEAAFRHDIQWPTRCLGRASCLQCVFQVRSGTEGLSDISRVEREALGSVTVQVAPGCELRLACQTKLTTDVTVRKDGVRRAQ